MTFETQAYEAMDTVNLPLRTKFAKWLSKLLSRELFDNELADDLADEPIEDDSEKHTKLLLEIQSEVRKLSKQKTEEQATKSAQSPN